MLEEDNDTLRVEEFITTTDPPSFKPIGKIQLSSFSLETICPKAQHNEQDAIVSLASSEDELSEEVQSNSDEQSDDELSEYSDDDSADSDYHELSWKEILDNCPDDFTFTSVSVSMDLHVNRQNPDAPRLEIQTLTVTLLPKRDVSPKRKTQSEDGKKTRKKG